MHKHPQRHSIDEAQVDGAPYWSVAKRFDSLRVRFCRHKTEHLPAHLLKSKRVEEVAQAEDLLEQVRYLQAHALHFPERAEKAAAPRYAHSVS